MTAEERTPGEGTKCTEDLAWGHCPNRAKGYAVPHGGPATATPKPFCGTHLRMHRSRWANDAEREHGRLDRERERAEQRKRHTTAGNLARFLTDQLGVSFDAAEDGRSLSVDVETAQRIYSARAVLATYVDGTILQAWRP